MTEQEQLTQILSLLNKLDDDIRQTNSRLQETNNKVEAINQIGLTQNEDFYATYIVGWATRS